MSSDESSISFTGTDGTQSVALKTHSGEHQNANGYEHDGSLSTAFHRGHRCAAPGAAAINRPNRRRYGSRNRVAQAGPCIGHTHRAKARPISPLPNTAMVPPVPLDDIRARDSPVRSDSMTRACELRQFEAACRGFSAHTRCGAVDAARDLASERWTRRAGHLDEAWF